MYLGWSMRANTCSLVCQSELTRDIAHVSRLVNEV